MTHLCTTVLLALAASGLAVLPAGCAFSTPQGCVGEQWSIIDARVTPGPLEPGGAGPYAVEVDTAPRDSNEDWFTTPRYGILIQSFDERGYELAWIEYPLRGMPEPSIWQATVAGDVVTYRAEIASPIPADVPAGDYWLRFDIGTGSSCGRVFHLPVAVEAP